MDHINDRADMSVFNGTEFEGLTYMQVRRRLTVKQIARLKALTKRNSRAASLKKASKRIAQAAASYTVHE
jgi:hypothetical protein